MQFTQDLVLSLKLLKEVNVFGHGGFDFGVESTCWWAWDFHDVVPEEVGPFEVDKSTLVVAWALVEWEISLQDWLELWCDKDPIN